MAEVGDVAAYICRRYPHKEELSKTRLTKLVYLADWEGAKNLGRQLTPIRWYFHNFGPWVPDIFDAVQGDPTRFEVRTTQNYYGDEKTVIVLKDDAAGSKGLSQDEIGVLDRVILETSRLYWNSFIEHVYATAPVASTDRYRSLDLLAQARELEQGVENRVKALHSL